MIDDMRMRQLAPKTQANYLRIVWGVTNAQRQPAKPNCDRSVKAGPLIGVALGVTGRGKSQLSPNPAGQ
jgi:hypothetical protein